MSYSFSARGATKAEVMEKVVAEFDKVVATQAVHAADRVQAQSTVVDFLDIVPDDTGGKDFYVSVSGSVSWNSPSMTITGASINVNASLVNKE